MRVDWAWLRKVAAGRRRLAPVVLVVGALVVGLSLMKAVPNETHVRYGLGPDHARVTRAVVEYFRGADRIQMLDRRWASGAPKSFDHELALAEGEYEVRATLEVSGEPEAVVLRSLSVPSEGVVHLDLFDMALARAGAASPGRGGKAHGE